MRKFTYKWYRIFLGIIKVRLSKFREISKYIFYLQLKECEFRFNNGHKTSKYIYNKIRKLVRDNPLDLFKNLLNNNNYKINNLDNKKISNNP